MSQHSRVNPALDPEYLKIDSRSTEELLIYIDQLSEEINFYNAENEIQGTWDDMLLTHPVITCIIAERFTQASVKDIFKFHQNRIQNAVSDDVKAEQILSLIQFLAKLSRICQSQIVLFLNPNALTKEDFLPFQMLDNTLKLLRSKFGNKFFQNTHIGEIHSTLITPDMPAFIDLIDYASIEKNNFLPLYKIAHHFARIIDQHKAQRLKYIDTHPLNEGELEPQIGIILSFTGLYKTIQQKANGLNKKHLDFYYKTLLQFHEKDQQADSAILVLETEADSKPIHLKAGHRFHGFTEQSDDAIEYNLVEDTTITKSTIDKIISLTSAKLVKLKSPQVTDIDLLETAVYCYEPLRIKLSKLSGSIQSNTAWNAFYHAALINSGQQTAMKYASSGLLVSSSLLNLPSGKREINIEFELQSASIRSLINFIEEYALRTQKSIQASTNEILSSAFILSYSGPEGWVAISEYRSSVKTVNSNTFFLELKFSLEESNSALVPCQKTTHDLAFICDRPAIKILASPYAEISPASFLTETHIERISIQTNVTEFRTLSLQNQLGPLSSDNPFLLFGPLPQQGNYFQFSCPYAINRYTNKLRVNINWQGLPTCDGGFHTHYGNYGQSFRESDFLVRLSSVKYGITSPETESREVFPLFHLESESNRTSAHTHLDIPNIRHLNLVNDGISNSLEFQPTNKGEESLRLEFISPEDGFGQNSYSKVFTEVVVHNSKKWNKKKALPNTPLTPLVENFSINYGLYVSERPDEIVPLESKNILLFHLHPFGYEDLNHSQAGTIKHLLPLQPEGGNVLIGIKDHEPGSILRLYFLLDEHSFHHTGHSEYNLNWSYLDGNTWAPFNEKNILSDSTHNLICSGIVALKTTALPLNKSTILDPDLYWIKIQSPDPQICNPRIIAIFTNAIEVQKNKLYNATHNSPVKLFSGSIRQSFENIQGVSAIHQIADSFNGRAAESDASYYQRVSERLSHQNRPVRPQDYIELILEHFPEILIVKCFHTTLDNYVITPGTFLHFILVPHFSGEILTTRATPLVSLKTMVEIKLFLQKHVSPFVKFEVGNPVYEQIKVIGKIKLASFAQSAAGQYLEQFIAELNNYISPWQSGDESTLQLGSKIYLTDMLNFIKSRSYIDNIFQFSVVHLYSHRNIQNNEIESHAEDTFYHAGDHITGTAPYAILIPSLHHLISIIEDESSFESNPTGIGQLIVGEELLLQEENWQNTSNESEEPKNDEDEFSIFISYQ